jgi:hypothetical protein
VAPPPSVVRVRVQRLRLRFSPSYRLREAAFKRGVRGGSSRWTYALVGLEVARQIRSVVRRGETNVTREVLGPGERVALSLILPAARVSRRAAKKAARSR